MSRFYRFGVLALLLVVAVSPATAKTRKKKATGPEYHDTVITSASATEIVVQQDKVSRTFPIIPLTEVTVRGQKAEIAALQPGMAVSVTIATDGKSAARITATDPPVHAAPVQPAKKHKH